METEMIIINKADISDLIEQIKIFNDNFKKMNFGQEEEVFFSREEAVEHYNIKKSAMDKIFNVHLKDKTLRVARTHKLAKKHIDKLIFEGGI